MITGINESKILTRHISCKCECKFHGRHVTRIKSEITVSVGESVKILKSIIHAKKSIFGILLHVIAKMVNI